MATGRLLTAEDVLATQYERGELWDGTFLVREPSGGWSGAVAFRLGALVARVLDTSPGWAFGSNQGFVVQRDPDRVLAPDLAYLSRERLAAPPARGFIEGPPEFAVEVRSPSDAWLAAIEKGGIWIGHGARVVWVVDPAAKVVVVMRPGAQPEEVRAGGRASARPALDLEVDVAALFEGLA